MLCLNSEGLLGFHQEWPRSSRHLEPELVLELALALVSASAWVWVWGLESALDWELCYSYH